MREVYENEIYRNHLKERNDKQYIMLGFFRWHFKDGGYLRANLSIFEAKERLTMLSRAFGVNVVFFDGRGGPPARGGGKYINSMLHWERILSTMKFNLQFRDRLLAVIMEVLMVLSLT
ncbi:MAG: phosphoenolpyruvate carboxylase [Saprospiraceae bacterium]